jgi:hypothetical protein
MATTAALTASAALGCTNKIAPQTGPLPPLNGKLVFQAVDASTYDHIFLYDFTTRTRVQIDAGWGFTEALNPHIGRNGAWVAFTAKSSACADNSDIDSQYGQIYVYQLGNPDPPTPLVACDHTSREDVKFSSDMGSVIFKHRAYVNNAFQYSLETMALTYNANGTVTAAKPNVLVQDATERSAPSLSPTTT